MKILAIDTTCNVATAAITENDRLLTSYTIDYKRTHSQKIMPIINDILQSVDLQVSDIDLFAVVNGPGSFTGVRIGVATMNGLSHVLQKPIIGVNTLEALAYNLKGVTDVICSIVDARHENLYYAAYEWKKDNLSCLIHPCADTLDNCLKNLQKLNKKIIFTGDAGAVYYDKICKILGDAAYFAGTLTSITQAASVAACAWDKAKIGKAQSYSDILPCYFRKSQAEREAEEKRKC